MAATTTSRRLDTCWNVGLWINNNEGLYYHALDCVRSHRTMRAAVRAFRASVPGRTPDGYRYTTAAVTEALRDLRECNHA